MGYGVSAPKDKASSSPLKAYDLVWRGSMAYIVRQGFSGKATDNVILLSLATLAETEVLRSQLTPFAVGEVVTLTQN